MLSGAKLMKGVMGKNKFNNIVASNATVVVQEILL